MRFLATIVFSVMIFAGCATTGNMQSNTSNSSNVSSMNASPPKKITMDKLGADNLNQNISLIVVQQVIPYVKNSQVALNIKKECKIGSQLSEFMGKFGKKYGVNITYKDKVSKTDKGAVLMVEIVDAVSRGNAFMGHSKFMTVKGQLYNNGNTVGSFTASRSSGGGAFGGFKGSCSVLGRTAKALGKDIASWLRSPTMNASLGEG